VRKSKVCREPKRIFSGINSRPFWQEIGKIDNFSTMDDVHNMFYTLGCRLQELEYKLECSIPTPRKRREKS